MEETGDVGFSSELCVIFGGVSHVARSFLHLFYPRFIHMCGTHGCKLPLQKVVDCQGSAEPLFFSQLTSRIDAQDLSSILKVQ